MLLTRDLLAILGSSRGSDLLREAACERGELLYRISRLRRHWPPELVSAAIELLDLRTRARTKFLRAEEMYFTREGLVQASGERIAAWRAARFGRGARIIDLCCGIGGDAIALAGQGDLLAVDRDPAALWCAIANASAHNVVISPACADVTRLRIAGDALFWDPARRAAGRRFRSGSDYDPPLAFYRQLLPVVGNLAIKVSPAIPDEEIDAAAADGARIEFVSDAGECKEAVLWFGGVGPDAERCASIVTEGITVIEDRTVRRPRVAPPGAWLLEPDPAMIRAHLLAEVCYMTGSWRLDEETAYLSAEADPLSPLVTPYRIVEVLHLDLKRIKSHLRKRDLQVTVVKKRGIGLDPEAVIRELRGTGTSPATLVLGRVMGAATAIICEPPPQKGQPKRGLR